jgi:N-acetylglucosaminyldiphosphoundecaprenol N-acetyl-beta-D-mannosaminyltransferase
VDELPSVRRPRVDVYGVSFDSLTEADVVAEVRNALADRRGGRIVTPNVDIVRIVRSQPAARAHLDRAALVLADGAPLVWASRLAGDPLPARVPGSDLIWSISAGLAEDARSVYLLGGEPGTAEKAAQVLAERMPALRVSGYASPPFGFESDAEVYDQMVAEVVDASPDFVFVGLGFPKQERVIDRLLTRLPSTWFMGCGAAIGFVAGTHRRAPVWMQRSGLEWLHRLGREPQRLATRYVRYGVPFAAGLLTASVAARLGGGKR